MDFRLVAPIGVERHHDPAAVGKQLQHVRERSGPGGNAGNADRDGAQARDRQVRLEFTLHDPDSVVRGRCAVEGSGHVAVDAASGATVLLGGAEPGVLGEAVPLLVRADAQPADLPPSIEAGNEQAWRARHGPVLVAVVVGGDVESWDAAKVVAAVEYVRSEAGAATELERAVAACLDLLRGESAAQEFLQVAAAQGCSSQELPIGAISPLEWDGR